MRFIAELRRHGMLVRRGAGDTLTVSMHLGHPGTLSVLPGLLDDLAVCGLTPVTAGALVR
jgi:hypothetical protein